MLSVDRTSWYNVKQFNGRKAKRFTRTFRKWNAYSEWLQQSWWWNWNSQTWGRPKAKTSLVLFIGFVSYFVKQKVEIFFTALLVYQAPSLSPAVIKKVFNTFFSSRDPPDLILTIEAQLQSAYSLCNHGCHNFNGNI